MITFCSNCTYFIALELVSFKRNVPHKSTFYLLTLWRTRITLRTCIHCTVHHRLHDTTFRYRVTEVDIPRNVQKQCELLPDKRNSAHVLSQRSPINKYSFWRCLNCGWPGQGGRSVGLNRSTGLHRLTGLASQTRMHCRTTQQHSHNRVPTSRSVTCRLQSLAVISNSGTFPSLVNEH